jgi:hypothetical protein
MSENFRINSEKHWDFIKKLIIASNNDFSEELIELIHILYVESMIHGYKHGQSDRCIE